MGRLEKKVAEKPDSIPDRLSLLTMLTNRLLSLPGDQVRELRRQQVLWLIEHHPEATLFESPASLLPTHGRLADPAGAAEAEGLWKELAGKLNASPVIVANAAIYLRAIDPAASLAILDAHPENPELSRARGAVDGALVLGMTGLGQGLQFGSSASLRNSAEAKAALHQIESSANAPILGKAGAVLATGSIETPFDLSIGDDDPIALAERWLRRAIELAPSSPEWKPALGQTLLTKANRTLDPKEKVRLLQEALGLVSESGKPGILQTLALAEFDANDDRAAERDARQLLAVAPKNGYAYHVAQTVLGRVAAAKGDLIEAKARLIQSVTMPDSIKNAVFQPHMTLAQDVYEAGDKDAVLQFLEASRTVWKFESGRIDRMIGFVKKAPSADLLQLSRQVPGGEMLRRPAPAFEAKDLDGKKWTREQLAGKVVALEFGKAPLAEKMATDRGAVLLQAQDDDTKRRFEVVTDPTVVVIDRDGIVAAFRSGYATEAQWHSEFDAAFGKGPNPAILPAPRQAEPAVAPSAKATISWEPVDNAESYVVEWDSRDEKGWIFDREGTVRVMATRETSVTLDLTGFTRLRWRVYAVPRFGQPGKESPWREIEGIPITKIYK